MKVEHAIYVLCALTALICALLLLRGYFRSRVRLLLWCSFAFLAMTVENVILFVDIAVVPTVDLSLIRRLIALGGVALLLYGLIWETK